MNQADIIAKLQREVATDEAFKAVCSSLAKRHRNRRVLNMQALAARMSKEGFHYSRSHYAMVLKKLAGMGLGKLETSRYGTVKSLTNIPLHLRAIGEFGLNPQPQPKVVKQSQTKSAVDIHFSIKGKRFVLTMPEAVTDEEVENLISWLTTRKDS